MARNLDCNCACHSVESHGDTNFCCKLCYSANHMSSLTRKRVVITKKPATPRKKTAVKKESV